MLIRFLSAHRMRPTKNSPSSPRMTAATVTTIRIPNHDENVSKAASPDVVTSAAVLFSGSWSPMVFVMNAPMATVTMSTTKTIATLGRLLSPSCPFLASRAIVVVVIHCAYISFNPIIVKKIS